MLTKFTRNQVWRKFSDFLPCLHHRELSRILWTDVSHPRIILFHSNGAALHPSLFLH